MTAELQRFKQLIAKAATGAKLDLEEAKEAFSLMMSGNATPAQMAGLLMALRVRGEYKLVYVAPERRNLLPRDQLPTPESGGSGRGTS